MSGMIDAVAKFRCIRSVQVCNKYTVRLTRCATQHGNDIENHSQLGCKIRLSKPILRAGIDTNYMALTRNVSNFYRLRAVSIV